MKPVIVEWVKISVPNKKSSFYLDSPGYQVLYKNDKGDLVVAFRRPLGELPHHIEKCNELEVSKLEHKRVI